VTKVVFNSNYLAIEHFCKFKEKKRTANSKIPSSRGFSFFDRKDPDIHRDDESNTSQEVHWLKPALLV